MEEIWVDIDKWEGYYQISNLGRVKSLYRKIVYPKGGIRIVEEKILKQSLTAKKGKEGYLFVVLSRKNELKLKRVHVLIAEHFIENPNNYPIVRHLNDNKLDNRIKNLAWGTAKDNMDDRDRNGKTVRGEKHHQYGKPIRNQDGEKNAMFGRKGASHPSFGKKGKYCGERHIKSKIVLDLQTGIFYSCVKEAAEAKGLKNNTLRGRLNGQLVNNTSLIYA